MLVLTRKAQQQIRVGENITITILRVKGQSVRVGIEAPRNIQIVRGELPPKSIGAADSQAGESEILEVTTSPSISILSVPDDRGMDIGKLPKPERDTDSKRSRVRSETAPPNRGLQPQVSARRVRAVNRLNGDPIDGLRREVLPPLRSTLGHR